MASIAAPSMSCEANRPLTSHSERNQNQTRAENGPAFTVPACLLTVTGRCMRRCSYENGGGCTIRTHGRLEATGCFQNSCNRPLCQSSGWSRRRDLNPRPLAYWASELPDCSTAQFFVCLLSKNGDIIAYIVGKSQGQKIHPAVCGRQGVPLRRNEPAKNKIGTSPRRSRRERLESAAALAAEDVSVGSMGALILAWRLLSTTPK